MKSFSHQPSKFLALIGVVAFVMIDHSIDHLGWAKWLIFWPMLGAIAVAQEAHLSTDHQILLSIMVGFPLQVGYWALLYWETERAIGYVLGRSRRL